MGAELLKRTKLNLSSLTHVTFKEINEYLYYNGAALFYQAFEASEKEMKKMWTISPKLLTGYTTQGLLSWKK